MANLQVWRVFEEYTNWPSHLGLRVAMPGSPSTLVIAVVLDGDKIRKSACETTPGRLTSASIEEDSVRPTLQAATGRHCVKLLAAACCSHSVMARTASAPHAAHLGKRGRANTSRLLELPLSLAECPRLPHPQLVGSSRCFLETCFW